MNHYGRVLLAAAAATCGGCTPIEPIDVRYPDELAQPAKNEFERERDTHPGVEQHYPSDALPALEIRTTDQTSDGRVMKLRGKIRNPLPDPITGVRMIMRIYTTGDSGPRELSVLQHEMQPTLSSGGTTMFRWDVESMYFGLAGRVGFSLEAYPERVADKDIPPPPGWKEN